MRTLLFTFILIIALSWDSEAQLQVKRISSASKLTETGGFVYSLPRAVVRIDVDVEIERHYKGPYAMFATELLGLRDFINRDYNTYKIKSFNISTITVPDAEQVFYASWNPRDAKDNNSLAVSLTPQGLIKSAGVFKAPTVAGISEMQNAENRPQPELFEFYYGPNLVKKVDTIIRLVNVDTNTFRKEFFNTRFELRPEKEKAMDAADYISVLRQNRHNLLSGYQEVAYSAEALRYMNEELKRLTDEYVSLFRGLKMTEKQRHTFYVSPANDDEAKLISLFKFSEENGISPSNGREGRDVFISFKKEGPGALLETFRSEGKSVPGGFYYRTSETVFAQIKYYGKTRKEEYLLLPQFGTIQQLPAGIRFIEYNVKDGSIKKLSWK